MLPARTALPHNVRTQLHLTMLPIAWITCCFLLGALVGTINKAGRGPFLVLARRAYSTSISPRTIRPQLAPPIGLPTLTGRVDIPIWPSTSHAADARITHTSVYPAPYLASYNVYSIGASSWLAGDNSDVLPVLGGVGVLLGVLAYLVCTLTRRHSKHARADRAVSTAKDAATISQLCVHPSSAHPAARREAVDDPVARSTTADFGRIRAEVVQLRKAVDALVAHTSKADETLRQLNAAHEELRGILESINDRSPRNPPDASSSNPWAIPSDHDAFSNSHFSESSYTLPKDDKRAHRIPVALDDDSQYLSTALGLTDWSDVPPRNGYYPTLDLLLSGSRSKRGSRREAWWVPSDELRAWIFPRRGAQVGSCAPTRDPDGSFKMPDPSEAGVGVAQKFRTLDEL
ncbi:hypothetical protein V8D89_013782 [Ganoderma adspersum]